MSTKKKGKTTPAFTGNHFKNVDLGTIRANAFDGVRNVVDKLPEGKQKNAILAEIENGYYWLASTFKGMASMTPAITPSEI